MTLTYMEAAIARKKGDILIADIRDKQNTLAINTLFESIRWPVSLNCNLVDTNFLTNLYYAKSLDSEFQIPVKAVQKIAWIMLHTELSEDDTAPEHIEFAIAEYIPPHAFLSAAEADGRLTPLITQLPVDRTPEVRAAMLYQLADYDKSWYPDTQVKQFVLSPDGFNVHVVFRNGRYQYITQS